MATLQSMPKEVILEILRHLPSKDMEQAALTFSRTLTDGALILLQPFFKKRQSAKRIEKQLGPINFRPKVHPGNICSDEAQERLRLSTPERKLILDLPPRDAFPDYEYLDCSGDLHWLWPLPEGLAGYMKKHRDFLPVYQPEHLSDLISSAERVGVTIPPAFLKFIQSVELQDRVLSSNAAYFYLGEGGLRKVPKSVDGVGGYLIRFLSDQQGCYFCHLYIEPGPDGAACVLFTDDDYHYDEEDDAEEEEVEEQDSELIRPEITEEETAEAEKMGIRMVKMYQKQDVFLVGIGFEEWLANMYHEELLWFVLHNYGAPADSLTDYVRNVYIIRPPGTKLPWIDEDAKVAKVKYDEDEFEEDEGAGEEIEDVRDEGDSRALPPGMEMI